MMMRMMQWITALLLMAVASVLSARMTDFTPVENDLKALFTHSKAFWPADNGHYGPLFVRLAWHCAGSYRTSDGRGGCDGARQRFDPERSWDDNTNLDKARNLLQPLKIKYGDALSWGDLIILAGTTAIEDMGGPVLGFCGGRIDDLDGYHSIKLGPSTEQQEIAPCPVNGECMSPLGTTTVGLIYLNPEGPMGNPDPLGSFPQVRDAFNRMAMNDSETVALIGGGHAFGKTHGACPLGPGPSPNQQPDDPWPGNCGSGAMKGKGPNAFTAGFEGSWTTTPTKWGNEYFQNLHNYEWTSHVGPGGRHQWQSQGRDTMMLTSDISLTKDPAFWALVTEYASDLDALNNAFSHAWYKLVTRDMGPVTRCIGNNVPPAQDFQYPLPPTPSKLADFHAVEKLINSALEKDPSMVSFLVHLSYQCSATFRQTDYQGGCNGARIRFPPESTWSVNQGTDKIIEWLDVNVKQAYKGSGALSFSDLITFAGQIGLQHTSGVLLEFCSGRTDATDGVGSEFLAPREFDDSNVSVTLLNVRDRQEISGLFAREWVVLQARLRPSAVQQAQGYSGSWSDSTMLSNRFFKLLLLETWKPQVSPAGKNEFVSLEHPGIYMTPQDLALIYDAEYLSIVQEFASDNQAFVDEFPAAWTKITNADRFDGPDGNACEAVRTDSQIQ